MAFRSCPSNTALTTFLLVLQKAASVIDFCQLAEVSGFLLKEIALCQHESICDLEYLKNTESRHIGEAGDNRCRGRALFGAQRSPMGRLPSEGSAQGERQLSRMGVSQAQQEDVADDFGKVPTTDIRLNPK
jgi:hypothetical protein